MGIDVIKRAFVLFFLFFSVAQAQFKIPSNETFQDWIRSAQAGTLEFSEGEREGLNQFHFVFVRGFLNEVIFSYFGQSRKALLKFGIQKNQITMVSPRSVDSIEKNVEHLREKILTIKQDPKTSGEKIVLIGHSKGAAGMVAFALKYPEFVEESVHGMIAIQGVFGGSSVADFLLLRNRDRLSNEIPFTARIFLGFLRQSAKIAQRFGNLLSRIDGLVDLATEENKKLWDRLQNEFNQNYETIRERLFFIKTEQTPKKSSAALRGFSYLTRWMRGESDGLVPTNSQALPKFDRDAGSCRTLFGDHYSLTHSSFSSNTSARYKRAVTMSLLKMMMH